MILGCSLRDLNPRQRLEKPLSWTGLDEGSSAEIRICNGRYLNDCHSPPPSADLTPDANIFSRYGATTLALLW